MLLKSKEMRNIDYIYSAFFSFCYIGMVSFAVQELREIMVKVLSLFIYKIYTS